MRSVSDLIVETKKPQMPGVVVLGVFVAFVVAVLGIPGAMIWAANSLG